MPRNTSKSLLNASGMYAIVILFVIFIFNTGAANEFRFDEFPNNPPVVLFDSLWRISEDEKVGTAIARVQANDNDPNEVFTFDMEPEIENETLPFRINKDTGVVYLNESLAGRGGDRFLLYVKVTDGKYNSKVQVYVNIKPKNGAAANGNGGGNPPFFQNGKNATHLFPPFHMLPGVPPRPYPNYPLPPNKYNDRNYHPSQTYPDVVPTSATVDSTSNNSNRNKSSEMSNTNANVNGTKSTSEISFNVDESNTQTTIENGTVANGGGNSTTETTIFPRNALKTVLPIAIIVCGIIIASGLIVSSFVFRKRLCAIGKSLKNKSKEEMAKKSNQSNLSSSMNTVMSSISENSRNSMVMQHWNGPTAFGNRYVPWVWDNSHIQRPSAKAGKENDSGAEYDLYDSEPPEISVRSVCLCLEQCLRAAKKVVSCREMLLPPDLLVTIARDILSKANDEPCGLRGALIFINFEDKKNISFSGKNSSATGTSANDHTNCRYLHSSNSSLNSTSSSGSSDSGSTANSQGFTRATNARNIGRVRWDVRTVTTFELYLTIMEDPTPWYKRNVAVTLRALPKGGMIVSNNYHLDKKKLYR